MAEPLNVTVAEPLKIVPVPFAAAATLVAELDADLHERNVSWGLRDLAKIEAEAAQLNRVMQNVVTMPANNLSVLMRRT